MTAAKRYEPKQNCQIFSQHQAIYLYFLISKKIMKINYVKEETLKSFILVWYKITLKFKFIWLII